MKKAMGHLIAALILSILCVSGLVCVIIGVTGVLPSILTLSMGFTAFLSIAQWCDYIAQR